MKQLMRRWTVVLPMVLSVFVLLMVTLAQQVTATGITTQLSLGDKYLQELNYEEAVIEFTKVIQIDRKNTQAYMGLADAYIGSQRSDLAIAILEDFSKKYMDTQVLEKLVDIYIRDGKYQEANKIINTLIEQTDDDKYYQKQDEIVAMMRDITVPISFSNNYLLFTKGTELYGMGKNLFGELGSTDHLGDANYTITTPQKLPFAGAVKSITAGSTTSYIVDNNGNLWAAGINLAAQQGDGSTIQNVTSFTQLMGISSVSSVAAGSTYAVALCRDGTVWAMGSNALGQLGIAQRIAPTPTQVSGLGNIVAVHAAAKYNLSHKADGRVYAMGVLPDGRTFAEPTIIAEKVVNASATDDYFALIDEDGKLIICGNSGINFNNLPGTVQQTGNGVEFLPSGYNIVQVAVGSNILGMVSSDGDVTILTGNGVETYTLPKVKTLYLDYGRIAILDSDLSLHLYSIADGKLTEEAL